MPEAEPSSARAASGSPAYRWYLGSAFSWFGGLGMQQVLIPWLVVGVLEASAEVTGTVQTVGMLPTVLLLFVGGAMADRLDPRRTLILLHLLSVLPPLTLAWCVFSDRLSVGVVMLAAMSMGAVNAFSFPARDSLLSRVAGGDLMRAVTGNTIAQFGSQGVGMALASLARLSGAAPILALQALLLAGGALLSARLPRGVPAARAARPRVSDLFAGLRIVLGSELRPVFVLSCGIGLLFSGSYWVVLPLAVRDVYAGSVGQISLLLAMFPLGAILGSGVLLRRGGVRRKGLALVLSLAAASGTLLVSSLGLPYPGLVVATLGWGLAGAVFMNTSRTLFQQRAPEAERARVLAMHQFGFLLTGPMGAFLSGVASAELGPLRTLLVLGCGMLALVGAVTLVSRVTSME